MKPTDVSTVTTITPPIPTMRAIMILDQSTGWHWHTSPFPAVKFSAIDDESGRLLREGRIHRIVEIPPDSSAPTAPSPGEAKEA